MIRKNSQVNRLLRAAPTRTRLEFFRGMDRKRKATEKEVLRRIPGLSTGEDFDRMKGAVSAMMNDGHLTRDQGKRLHASLRQQAIKNQKAALRAQSK